MNEQIYATLGGLDNLRTARKHYAHSIELNKTRNLRAYLALVSCTKSIAAHRNYRADQDDNGLNERLQQFALDFLERYYASEVSPELATIGTLHVVSIVGADVVCELIPACCRPAYMSTARNALASF